MEEPMLFSMLATMHADTLDRSACNQIANFARQVAFHANDGMSRDEKERFYNLYTAIQDVLAMQTLPRT
jgi:hypothetical protein